MRSSLPQPRRLFLAGLVGALLLPTLILVSSAEAKSNTPPLLLERRAQEADAPLGYRIYGAADAPETLVLCPGAFYNSNQYAFLLRALESSPHRGRFKVVVFDYPGIGLSSNIHGLGPDASPRKLAGLGTQLLTHLARTGEIGRKEKVHLYGLSLGALVALGMAGEAPDMIDTVYAAQGPSPNLLATSEQLRSVREGMVSWTQDYERFLQAYPDSERKHLEGPLLTAWISMMEQPAREKTFEKAIAQLKPPARKAAMALLKRTPRSLKSALFRKIFEPIVRGTEVSAYGNLLFALSQPSPEQMTEIGELVGGGRLAKVQVTLAYGSHDEMAPPESFEELKALVPHAEREILDGMVHGAPISIPWHAKTALKNLIDRIDGHPAKFKKHRDWKARLRLIRKVQSRKGLRQAARLATPKLKVQAKKVKNR